MGNAQSTTAEARKISKPKSVGNMRASKSATPSDSPQDPSVAPFATNNASQVTVTIASPSYETLSGEEFRREVRQQLLSPSPQPAMAKDGQQVDLLAATVARSLSRSTNTLSARSSMAKLPNASQTSLSTERTVDLKTAISIIQELKKTASPEDLAALHQALLYTASKEPSPPPPMQDEAKEPQLSSTKSMIRRKSLAQPGLATRIPKVMQPPAKRHSVPTPTITPQMWRKEMMGMSPLARLSGLDGLEPPPEIVENRSHTPNDLEYSQIGNLKHGSLMVVNGPPSPVPSAASPGSTRNFSNESRFSIGPDDNYFTASEQASPRRNNAMPPRSRQTSATKIPGIPSIDVQRASASLRKPVPTRSVSSPLKKSFEATENMPDQPGNKIDPVEHGTPEQTVAVTSTSRPRRFSFEDNDEGADFKPSSPSHQGPMQSSISLASGYMAEIPSSPFKEAQTSPSEDEFYSPLATDHREAQNPEIVERVIDLPPVDSQILGQISPRKPLRSHPAVEPGVLARTERGDRPVTTKTDSGYSSSASTSLVDKPSFEMHQPNLSTVESLADPADQPRFYASQDALAAAVQDGHELLQHETPDTTAGSDGIIIRSIEVDPPRAERLGRAKSWRKSVRRSLPRLLSHESTTSIATKASTMSAVSSNESKPKKLQKRRPTSQPPINISDRHLMEQGIPRVPSGIFSRHNGRLSASPGFSHLEKTHEEPPNEQDLSNNRQQLSRKPSLPSCFFPDAEESAAPNVPTQRPNGARKSFRRSRSQVDADEVLATGIADFGTVSQSLGASPYDAAVTIPRPRTGPATQPHHFGTKAPQRGPREGWDAETASRFGQMRSRERAAHQEMLRQRAHTGGRQQMPPRPKSYHDDLSGVNYHVSDMPMSRPKSMHSSGPPIDYYQGYQQQQPQPAPQFAPPPPNHAPASQRDVSPVKNLVNAFEQRASQTPAPPPMPQSQPDWSDPSRVWRERRLAAQHTTVTTSSLASHVGKTMTVSTTTVTTSRPPPQRHPQRPAPTTLQNRKSMPQLRGTVTTTTTMSSPAVNRASCHDRLGCDGRNGCQHLSRTPNELSPKLKKYYGIDLGQVPYRVI